MVLWVDRTDNDYLLSCLYLRIPDANNHKPRNLAGDGSTTPGSINDLRNGDLLRTRLHRSLDWTRRSMSSWRAMLGRGGSAKVDASEKARTLAEADGQSSSIRDAAPRKPQKQQPSASRAATGKDATAGRKGILRSANGGGSRHHRGHRIKWRAVLVGDDASERHQEVQRRLEEEAASRERRERFQVRRARARANAAVGCLAVGPGSHRRSGSPAPTRTQRARARARRSTTPRSRGCPSCRLRTFSSRSGSPCPCCW